MSFRVSVLCISVCIVALFTLHASRVWATTMAQGVTPNATGTPFEGSIPHHFVQRLPRRFLRTSHRQHVCWQAARWASHHKVFIFVWVASWAVVLVSTFRFWASMLLQCLTIHHDRTPKGVARRMVFPRINIGNHPHAKSAAHRLAATTAVTEFCNQIGYTRYDVQQSNRESCAGGRSMHTPHDVAFDKVPDCWFRRWLHAWRNPKSLLSLIDVVYYTGFQHIWGAPQTIIALYMLVPKGVAGETEDGFYRFNKDGTITDLVPGGAQYTHPVFRPTQATTVFHTWFYSTLYETVVVNDESQHKLVFFVPISTTFLPTWLYNIVLGTTVAPLTSEKVHVHGDFIYTVVYERNDAIISVTRASGHGSHCIDMSYDRVQTACAALAGLPTNGQRIRELLDLKDNSDVAAMTQFCGATLTTVRGPTISFAPSDMVAKAVVDAIPAPLVKEPHAFASNTETLVQAFQKRYRDRPAFVPDDKDKQRVGSFVGYLASGVGNIIPKDLEATQLNQTTAQQRQRNALANKRTDRNVRRPKPSPFVKLETGVSSKPRMIIQLDAVFNNTVARYSQPLAEALYKAFGPQVGGWFACKGTPGQIAARMGQLVEIATLSETDYSMFDGSVGSFHRYILKRLCHKVFPKECHEEIDHLIEAETNLKVVVTQEGKTVWVKQLDGQVVSGSGWTSVLASVINGWLYYCAACELRGEEAAPEAMKEVLVFGDDGVGPKDLVTALTAVASRQGITTTVECHETYVTFLARVYPRTGKGLSFAQPSRAIGKLCSGLKTSTIRERAQSHRILGYTPLVSELADAILRIKGEVTSVEWAAAIAKDRTLSFKTSGGAWPSFTPDSVAMAEAAVEDLASVRPGTTWAEIEAVIRTVNDCNDWTTLVAALDTYAMPGDDVGGLAW